MKEKLNNKISALKKTCDEQVDEIRTIYDEKLKTLSDNKSFILEEIFNLKQQKTKIEYTVHFKTEIDDYEDQLRSLSVEEKDTAMKVERMKLDCDRFRQKSQEETGLSDKKYDTEIDDIVCHRKQ